MTNSISTTPPAGPTRMHVHDGPRPRDPGAASDPDFPDYYHFSRSSTSPTTASSRATATRCSTRTSGVDGLKTGHTEESRLQSGRVGRAQRPAPDPGGQRPVEHAASGRPKADGCSTGASASPTTYALFKKGDVVDKADVWLGAAPTVPLVIDRILTITLPRTDRDKMTVKAIYRNPIPAPVTSRHADRAMVVIPPSAGADRGAAGRRHVGRPARPFGRLNAARQYLVWG